eukprot:622638_1
MTNTLRLPRYCNNDHIAAIATGNNSNNTQYNDGDADPLSMADDEEHKGFVLCLALGILFGVFLRQSTLKKGECVDRYCFGESVGDRVGINCNDVIKSNGNRS